jgi:hypothetical protein
MVAVVDGHAQLAVEIRAATAAGLRRGFVQDYLHAACCKPYGGSKAGQTRAYDVNYGHQMSL